MTSPGTQELAAAVAGLHAALDGWAAAVEGVAAEAAGDPTDALSDPRLEAAQDTFYERLSTFEEATLPVLGLATEEPAIDVREVAAPTWDDFFLHFEVGVPDDDEPSRLQDAFDIVHRCGHETAERLVDAGFDVPTFAASRGELDLDGLEDVEDVEDVDDVEDDLP